MRGLTDNCGIPLAGVFVHCTMILFLALPAAIIGEFTATRAAFAGVVFVKPGKTVSTILVGM